MQRWERLCVGIAIANCVTYFLLLVYPRVDDFDLWHMRVSLLTSVAGHVDPGFASPGFYVLTVMVSETTAIPFVVIPTLPLELLVVFLMLLSLLRRLGSGNLAGTLLVLAYVVFGGSPSGITWGEHNLGFVLLLALIFLVLLRRNQVRSRTQTGTSLGLLVIVASLNFLSYKMIFAAVTFLFASATLDSLVRLVLRSPLDRRLTGRLGSIGFFGLVFVLSYNEFFYDSFLPVARLASEESASSGMARLLGQILPGPSSGVAQFHYQLPIDLRVAKALWFGIILLNVVLTFAFMVKHRRLHERLDAKNIVLATSLSGALILGIYSELGFADLSIVVISGLLGYGLLARDPRDNIRKYVALGVIAIFALSLFAAVATREHQAFAGQRIPDSLESVDSMSRWYLAYGNGTVMTSDVFTLGYLLKATAEAGVTNPVNLAVITNDQVALLANSQVNQSEVGLLRNRAFILNYDEAHFTIFRWETFAAWSSLAHRIESNPSVSKVYSSGSFDIFVGS